MNLSGVVPQSGMVPSLFLLCFHSGVRLFTGHFAGFLALLLHKGSAFLVVIVSNPFHCSCISLTRWFRTFGVSFLSVGPGPPSLFSLGMVVPLPSLSGGVCVAFR